MNALKLKQLSQRELNGIQGGDYTESFTDPEGYKWTYSYNDAGELLGFCVVRVMILK